MKDKKLLNKVAIVTGAGRGIGRAIALMLANAGAHVVLTARTISEIDAAAQEVIEQGGSAEAIPADLTKEDDIIALLANVHKEHGKLDILINNAGLGIYGPFIEVDTDDFDAVLSVNLRASFLCCREAMKFMTVQNSGYIINISSVVGIKGYPNQAAYAAAKHGIMGLTKSLAAETEHSPIRVSVVLPGATDTEMVRKARPDIDPEDLMQPEDIAQAVEYLLSLSERASVDELYIRRRTSKPF